MGSNVFGTPVTEEMLKALPEYHEKKIITQIDKAKVALEMKNAEGKDVNAKRFVENLKNAFGNVCTMGLIYNATGETVIFHSTRDWRGRVCESPYPMIIANGQWGAFLHGQHYGDQKASKAGVVYSALNNEGFEKHWFMGFYNSPDLTNNGVYAEIRDIGHYTQDSGSWPILDSYLNNQEPVSLHKEYGGFLSATIGNISYPVFEAVMTLPEAVRG